MTCPDPLGCWLVAYEEYMDGKRRYEDLPPALAKCPDKAPAHERYLAELAQDSRAR